MESFSKLVLALSLLTLICVGLLFKARSFLADAPLVLSKQDIVGSYDSIYDKYFPRHYHATGLLSLPFDNIVEPFAAWFTGKHNMSRIDYYNGMDKTIQRGDLGHHGVLFKIIPKHFDLGPSDNNFISCWYKPVSKWLPRAGQSVVPTNLTAFKFEDEEIHRGIPSLKYVRRTKQYNKTNTYSLYITKEKPHRPLRYEMYGYDDLLTSHYDHYILDYVTFEPWKFNFTLFELPDRSSCHQTAKKVKCHYQINPMAEYMHFNHAKDPELERSYSKYKKKHGKKYKTPREHEERKHIYKHNFRFIVSKNSQNLRYRLAPNHFADMTEREARIRNGLLYDNTNTSTQKQPSDQEAPDSVTITEIPAALDWRDYGAVTPVHSQGLCGSCWTFSAVGAVEAAYFLETGKLKKLSNQQLLDCSWPEGNHGCKGGFQDRTLNWIKRNGVALEKDYGPYLAQEGFCHCGPKDNCTVAHIDGFIKVKKHKCMALKSALSTHGPIASSINADRKTLRFYSHGVYDDPKCGNNTNHAVLTVGYNSDATLPYWVIKNSWGHLWGENGYIKVAMKHNTCGLTNGPLLAVKNRKNEEKFPFKHLRKVSWQDTRNTGEEGQLTSIPF